MDKTTMMSCPRARSYARPWRWAKTLFFVAAMLASLLLDCAPPLLLVVLDLLFPLALLSAAPGFSLSASMLSQQMRSFDFRSSLVDVPAVSAFRSLHILGAFLLFGGSGGMYLGITAVCSSASAVYLLVKQFSMLPVTPRKDTAAAAAASAVEALFVVSLAMAVAHVVVAYRTSCRQRRKLLVYRIDVEAVIINFILRCLISDWVKSINSPSIESITSTVGSRTSLALAATRNTWPSSQSVGGSSSQYPSYTLGFFSEQS